MNIFFLLFRANEQDEISEDYVFMSWILFSHGFIAKSRMIEIICDYLELFQPFGYHSVPTTNRKEENFHNHPLSFHKTISRAPYSASHHLVWKIFASILGPIPPENQLNLTAPVSHDCEITGHVRNAVAVHDFINNNKETKKGILNPFSLKAQTNVLGDLSLDEENHKIEKLFIERAPLWQSTVLAGTMLDDFVSSVLPFECDEVLQSFTPRSTSSNDPTNLSILSFPKVLLDSESTEDNYGFIEENILRGDQVLWICSKYFQGELPFTSSQASNIFSQNYFREEDEEGEKKGADGITKMTGESSESRKFSILEDQHQLQIVRNLSQQFEEGNQSLPPESDPFGSLGHSSSAGSVPGPNRILSHPLVFKEAISFIFAQHRPSPILEKYQHFLALQLKQEREKETMKTLLHQKAAKRYEAGDEDEEDEEMASNDDGEGKQWREDNEGEVDKDIDGDGDSDYLIERLQIPLRTEEFFNFSKSSRWKKEKKRNHTTEKIFLLGKKLIEILTFQMLVASVMLTQDCFLVVRGVQLFFQQILYYQRQLLASCPESSQTDEEIQVLQRKRKEFSQRRDHLVRCLQCLRDHGINLQRAVRLSFDWGLRHISVTDSHPVFSFQKHTEDGSEKMDTSSAAYASNYFPHYFNTDQQGDK